MTATRSEQVAPDYVPGHEVTEEAQVQVLAILIATVVLAWSNELERTAGRYGLQTTYEGGRANSTLIERLG